MPRSAELKLIQKMQKRVYQRTKAYDEKVAEDARKSPEAIAEAKELSRKQGRVTEMTRKLANKINKESQANDNQ